MTWDWDRLQRQNQRQSGPPIPPQWDELVDKFKNTRFPGIWIIIIVLILLYIGSSSVYTVEVDEVGVIQRFGAYNRTGQPGLHFKFPSGIEKVTKVKDKRVYTKEFGFRTLKTGQTSRFGLDNQENVSLMLTGDLNVAVVPWVVQYRIKDPYLFLFKVDDPGRLLEDMAEATMRLIVGDRSINEVISKREEIADHAKILLQNELDKADTGIIVIAVELKRTNVPEPVQPSFNEVNQSIQEKEQLIYQAREQYNKEIPKAKGEADRMIKTAEGFALELINRAQGDVQSFIAQQKEYAEAKDVTRRRLYLEAMKELLPKLGKKIIVDDAMKNVLPFLNIDTQPSVNVSNLPNMSIPLKKEANNE